MAARTVTVPVTSLRKLDWDLDAAQFLFVTTPGALASFPAEFHDHLPPARRGRPFTTRLTQAFPNLTVIDVSAIMRQVNGVLDQVIRAVQFVFLFALLAGRAGAVRGAALHPGRAAAGGGADARVRAAPRWRGRNMPSFSPWDWWPGCSPRPGPTRSATCSPSVCSSSRGSSMRRSGLPGRWRAGLRRAQRLAGRARRVESSADAGVA